MRSEPWSSKSIRHPSIHPPTDPYLFRGRKIYEPPRFMTVAQAADQLMQIVQRRRGEGEELGE